MLWQQSKVDELALSEVATCVNPRIEATNSTGISHPISRKKLTGPDPQPRAAPIMSANRHNFSWGPEGLMAYPQL
jgi:hypothetical protein